MDIWVAAGFLDIWIIGYFDISQKIEELVAAAGYLDIWIFGYLDISQKNRRVRSCWIFGYVDIRISGYLDISQKMEQVSAAGYFSLNGNGFSPTMKFQTYLGN